MAEGGEGTVAAPWAAVASGNEGVERARAVVVKAGAAQTAEEAGVVARAWAVEEAEGMAVTPVAATVVVEMGEARAAEVEAAAECQQAVWVTVEAREKAVTDGEEEAKAKAVAERAAARQAGVAA